jgi:hypothetical protein
VESHVPDLFHTDDADVHPDTLSTRKNRLVGQRILIGGKTYYKGYVGYVRSIAGGTAHLELDANHRIESLPLKDVIDL